MAQVVCTPSVNLRPQAASAPSELKPSALPPKFYTSDRRRGATNGGGRGHRLHLSVSSRFSRSETAVLAVSPDDLLKEEEKFRQIKKGNGSTSVWSKPNERRKTKIVCTIGPSTDTKEMIWKLAEAGMNVARLNMSHGDHASHQKVIDLVKEYNAQTKDNVIAIMLDTKEE